MKKLWDIQAKFTNLPENLLNITPIPDLLIETVLLKLNSKPLKKKYHHIILFTEFLLIASMSKPPALKFKEKILISQLQAKDVPANQNATYSIEIQRPNNDKLLLYEFENTEQKSLWLSKIPGVKKVMRMKVIL